MADGRAHIENEVKLLPQLVNRSTVLLARWRQAGIYTIALSPIARQVIAFEPVPHNLGTLRQAICLAGLNNSTSAPGAVGRDGHRRFRVPD